MRHVRHLHTSSQMIDFDVNLRDYYSEYIVNYIVDRLDDEVCTGSGFIVSEIIEIEFQVNYKCEKRQRRYVFQVRCVRFFQ